MPDLSSTGADIGADKSAQAMPVSMFYTIYAKSSPLGTPGELEHVAYILLIAVRGMPKSTVASKSEEVFVDQKPSL